jgi:hypothetical protein
LTCRKACFEKERGNNRYVIFAAAEEYDPKKDDSREGTIVGSVGSGRESNLHFITLFSTFQT